MGINPAGKVDYKPIADANFESNKQQFVGRLPTDVIELIMARVSASDIATASLIGRRWLKAADQEHKNILLTYLRTIANGLDPQFYTNQKCRLIQLTEKVALLAPENLRLPAVKKEVAQSLVDILSEVKVSDVDKIVLNPNYIPPEFANILDIAKRTFKGNMAFHSVGTVFTNNYPDSDLAGRRFLPNEVNPSNGKRIETDEHVLYFYPDGEQGDQCTIYFPRLVEDRMLEGKKYGDVIHYSIAEPSFSTEQPPKGPWHFIFQLIPSKYDLFDQTLAQKIEKVLSNPETRVDKIDKQYNKFMKADQPKGDNK